MKKIWYAMLILFNFLVSCYTRDKTVESTERPYYIVKRNGEVYIRQNDKVYEVLKESMALENGYTVSPSGRVDLNNGRKIHLSNGQAMYLNGEKQGEIVNADLLLK
jgi:hypothetical protein